VTRVPEMAPEGHRPRILSVDVRFRFGTSASCATGWRHSIFAPWKNRQGETSFQFGTEVVSGVQALACTATLVTAVLALDVTGAGAPSDRGSTKDSQWVPPFSWTGSISARQRAALRARADFSLAGGGSFRLNPFDIDAFVADGTIGYNPQINGNWLAGIEADLPTSNIAIRRCARRLELSVRQIEPAPYQPNERDSRQRCSGS
jgi:hypothetical protein